MLGKQTTGFISRHAFQSKAQNWMVNSAFFDTGEKQNAVRQGQVTQRWWQQGCPWLWDIQPGSGCWFSPPRQRVPLHSPHTSWNGPVYEEALQRPNSGGWVRTCRAVQRHRANADICQPCYLSVSSSPVSCVNLVFGSHQQLGCCSIFGLTCP